MKVGNAIRPESRRSCIVNESAESVGRERERERQTDRQTDRQRESLQVGKLQKNFISALPRSVARTPARPNSRGIAAAVSFPLL